MWRKNEQGFRTRARASARVRLVREEARWRMMLQRQAILVAALASGARLRGSPPQPLGRQQGASLGSGRVLLHVGFICEGGIARTKGRAPAPWRESPRQVCVFGWRIGHARLGLHHRGVADGALDACGCGGAGGEMWWACMWGGVREDNCMRRLAVRLTSTTAGAPTERRTREGAEVRVRRCMWGDVHVGVSPPPQPGRQPSGGSAGGASWPIAPRRRRRRIPG